MDPMPRPSLPFLNHERNRHGRLVWYVRVGKGRKYATAPKGLRARTCLKTFSDLKEAFPRSPAPCQTCGGSGLVLLRSRAGAAMQSCECRGLA